MKRKKILINCSNLHVGGGVAVATSFLDCLSTMEYVDIDISLLVSSEVDNNLRELKTDLKLFEDYMIKDFFGISALWKGLDNYFNGMDLVFTVFGPAYYLSSRTNHIFGFAQPLIIYPSNPISKQLNMVNQLKLRVKYKIQEWFYSRANSLIVELEHVEKQLKRLPQFKDMPIHVVYSSVHSIYNQPDKWVSLTLPNSSSNIKLGIISRNYPHKNLKILPKVKEYLQDNCGLCIDFFVTFRDEEWKSCSSEFKKSIINVGGLSLSQCPTFYSLMDGVIFPSLLECFSAVPIEAMMSKKPLFASDLPFIRDVCGNHCNYFDPLDAADISKAICSYFFSSKDQRMKFVDDSYDFVEKYTDPKKRASEYMSNIRDALVIPP